MSKKHTKTKSWKVELKDKLDQVRVEINNLTDKRINLDDQTRQKQQSIDELCESNDQVAEKRNILQKKIAVLKENIEKYSRVADQSRLNIKGTDLLKKEDVYLELVGSFENILNKRY